MMIRVKMQTPWQRFKPFRAVQCGRILAPTGACHARGVSIYPPVTQSSGGAQRLYPASHIPHHEKTYVFMLPRTAILVVRELAHRLNWELNLANAL